MRKNRMNIGVLAAVAISFAAVTAGLAQGTHPTRDFMRHKLAYTQGIVEGITLEKYDLIVTNASSLRTMNLTNAFLTLKNPDYILKIGAFQHEVDGLLKAAKAHNLQDSTEGYSRVVSSCVSCHQLFRREQFLKQQN